MNAFFLCLGVAAVGLFASLLWHIHGNTREIKREAQQRTQVPEQ